MFGYKAWVTKGGTVHETVEPDFVSFLFSCFSSFNYYTCSLPSITIHSQVEIISRTICSEYAACKLNNLNWPPSRVSNGRLTPDTWTKPINVINAVDKTE